MKNTILIVSMVLVSFGAFAQHDHGNHGDKNEMDQKMEPMFKDKTLGTAFGYYIHLKNALVASDVVKANEAAVQLELALQDIKEGAKALAEARMVSRAQNMDDQRTMFVSLSTEMIALVKTSKLAMGAIYVDYCPMANNDSGASWLSNDMAITNPYFGNKMMNCGSVTETIK